MIETIVRRCLTTARALICALTMIGVSATVAAGAKADRLELCEEPISLEFEGLPTEPPSVTRLDVCSAETDRSLYDQSSPFVGDQAQLDALYARAPKLTVTRDPRGIGLRITLHDGEGTQRIYEAKELAAQGGVGAGKPHPLVRRGHEGGPELAVSIHRTEGGPFFAVDVKNAPVAQLARDAARAASVDLQHAERLDAALKMNLQFSMLPLKALLATIAYESEVSLTTDRNGAFVVGAIKDFKQISELETLAYEQRSAGDNAALAATLEKIVALAKPNDADDVALDASDTMARLEMLAFQDSRFAEAEKWQRLLLAEMERAGRSDTRDYALALIELGQLRFRQDDSEAAGTHFERGLALFDRHESAPLKLRDATIAGPYLSAVRHLAAIRTGQGDFRGAIGLWQRVVDHRIEWLGSDHALAGSALRDLSLLQRCAAQDSEAIATLQRIEAASASPPPEPQRKIDDELMSYLDPELKVLLLPQLVAADDRLKASRSVDRLRQVEIRECIAEDLAQESLEIAALQYQTALAMRIDLQGRDHPQTQRTARRTIELLERVGKGGAEQIHQQMQPR